MSDHMGLRFACDRHPDSSIRYPSSAIRVSGRFDPQSLGPAARKRLFLLPEPLQLLLFYGERITLSLWLVCVPIPPGVVLYVRLPVLRLFFF
jgi:hypothetical protein